ncbi:hypothetical protein A7U60_g5560 [Sanghuangporus baumii]|uniref:Uncharacterized protein n=1 Tax=Sanghuangporus baumii TaxID=108892 RepID=A0A9Q5N3I9_SANBA|nr:hypothetical protein A7U60_g5560 [Sanghuangporus baumii]
MCVVITAVVFMLYFGPVIKGILSAPPSHTFWCRYDLKFTTATLVQQRRSLHRLSTHAYRHHESTALQSPLQKAAWRSFSSSSRNQARRFGGFILKMSLTGAAIYFSWSVTTLALIYWHNLNPPQLAGWPEEVREPLVNARAGICFGIEDEILGNLKKAWIAVQNVPTGLLNPDPSVKMLSVAIWFSDQLEKAGQAYRAYEVLCDAVDLYHSRFQTHSLPLTSDSANTLSSADCEERRYLISVLTKLAILAEKYEPAAEGKWLSHALREIIPLLPLCQGLPKALYDVMTSTESLAAVDACFSGISHLVDSSRDLSACSAESQQIENNSAPTHDIPEDEITPEDELLFLPHWCSPDLVSSIVTPIEHLGVYAGKHGDRKIAVDAFRAVIKLFAQQLAPTADNNGQLIRAEVLLRLLKTTNRRMEFYLRQMETANDLTEWTAYLMHAKLDASCIPHYLNLTGLEGPDAKTSVKKVHDRNDIRLAEFALARKNLAIFYEKLGEADFALNLYQASLRCWELSGHHAKYQGMKDVQERIEALKQNIAEEKAAWTAVQNIPIELLNPDPSVKMLSVAIWFSDQLEKAGQAYRAYKVLCDAVDLYQSRFRMYSPPRELPKSGTVMTSSYTRLLRKVENGPTNILGPVNTEEMRYLISVLTKLATLAGMYEPTAEGKWLSHALHELIPLLSHYQDLPKEKVYGVLVRAEDLATVDSCFSGISVLVNSGLNQSDSSAEARKMEDKSSPDHYIPEDEITPEDECLFLPFWCPSDLMSAIAVTIDYLGVYAGKHGNLNVAIDAFYVALLLLSQVYISAAPDHDAGLVGWEVNMRAIEISNHETEIFLRMLEAARYPAVWTGYLKLAATSAARAPKFIREGGVKRLDAKAFGRKVVDRNNISLAVGAVAFKHVAFVLEKLGEPDSALEYYQSSLKFWETSEHHTSHLGMMDVQEHIRTLKWNIAEGKASMEDQMKSMLLKASQEGSERESQDVGSENMDGIKSI